MNTAWGALRLYNEGNRFLHIKGRITLNVAELEPALLKRAVGGRQTWLQYGTARADAQAAGTRGEIDGLQRVRFPVRVVEPRHDILPQGGGERVHGREPRYRSAHALGRRGQHSLLRASQR